MVSGNWQCCYKNLKCIKINCKDILAKILDIKPLIITSWIFMSMLRALELPIGICLLGSAGLETFFVVDWK